MDDVTQDKPYETVPTDLDGTSNERDSTGGPFDGEAPGELPASTIDDRLQALQTELAAAQAEVADYRTAGCAPWPRRRIFVAAERAAVELTLSANERLLLQILPVVDDFDLAFAHLPADLSEQDQSWVDGFALILRKLQAVLNREGVVAIETAGMTFDPNLHEAVTYETAEGFTENQIIGEIRKGYLLVTGYYGRPWCAPHAPTEHCRAGSETHTPAHRGRSRPCPTERPPRNNEEQQWVKLSASIWEPPTQWLQSWKAASRS
ncbi:MAG: nucleotide exchange factor GrpE [Anaerolineae bacterium]|nr:MAG: nucleotide exchange factor GrpE [Anaerolineae bacterium]